MENGGEIIVVDGINASGKQYFINNLKKQISNTLLIDSSNITKKLKENEKKDRYQPFKDLQKRNDSLDIDKQISEKKIIIIDRDIIGALAFHIHYFDEQKDKNKYKGNIRYFGSKTKKTEYYEENLDVYTNRNAIKEIIKEHLKHFPEGVKKTLYYFKANRTTIIKRLQERKNNPNSGTTKQHYDNLINDPKYYNRYQYSSDLALLLFKEVIEEKLFKDWEIIEKNTSNL